jgi:hypothetical protein
MIYSQKRIEYSGNHKIQGMDLTEGKYQLGLALIHLLFHILLDKGAIEPGLSPED